MHQLFDTLQFRVLRERLYATLSAVEPEADQGFDVDVRVAGRRRGGRVARRARPDRRALRARLPRHLGSRHRHAVRRGDRRRRRRGRVGRPDPARRRRTKAALAAWLADPDQPKAVHDVKGPLLALAAHGLHAGGRHQRHRAGGLPGAARAALLRPRRPRAALPAPRAAGRDPCRQLSRPTASSPSTATAAKTDEAWPPRTGCARGRPRPGDRARAGSGAPRRHPAAARDRAARWSACCRTWSGSASPPTPSICERLSAAYGAEVTPFGAGRLRRGRPRVQPRLTQAAAGRAVRRAGPAQDQADQDRLHHRRRRAGLARGAERPSGDPGAAAPP